MGLHNQKKQKKMKVIQKASQNQTPSILDLPNELLDPIIKLLPLYAALQLRLCCNRLNHNVETFFKRFRMNLCADKLIPDQLGFLSRINLQKITFKRVAKPLINVSVEEDLCFLKNPDDLDDDYAEWFCQQEKTQKGSQKLEKLIYNGPSQYLKVGGIQERSLSVAAPYLTEDFDALKTYLLGIGTKNIFDYVLI